MGLQGEGWGQARPEKETHVAQSEQATDLVVVSNGREGGWARAQV